MVLLSGVAIFSYIMGVFVEIINKFIDLDADFEDSDNLEKFYSLMQHFNNGRPFNIRLRK